MDWYGYKRTLALDSEAALHPHSPRERADLFSAVTFEGTEIEYLDLLHCLVLARKPLILLETGTNTGLSALAIGFALKEIHGKSGRAGKLYSLEHDAELARLARENVEEAGVADYVAIAIGDSVDFIVGTGDLRFEWVFFDSSRRVRPKEFRALVANDRLAPGCLLAFHDTSELRAESMPQQSEDQREYLGALRDIAKECCGQVTFPLSRGLWVLQWREETRA